MARFALTDRFVQNAKSRDRQSEYFDDTTRGLSLEGFKRGEGLVLSLHHLERHTQAPNTRHLPGHDPIESPHTGDEARGLLEAGDDPRTITAAAESPQSNL